MMDTVERNVEKRISACVKRLIASVLPVPRLSVLLGQLAVAWRDIGQADSVFVFAQGPQGALQGRLLDKSATALDVDLDDHVIDFDRIAAQLAANNSAESKKPSVSQRFCFGDETLGGVLLYGVSDEQFDQAVAFEEIASLSAGLIAQRLIIDKNSVKAQISDDFARELLEAKMAALAEFAAGAGHEINNPVATIVGRASQLLKSEKEPERRQALSTIGGQAYRIRDMIGDLMLFARPPAIQPEQLNLHEVVETVLSKKRDAAAQLSCDFRLQSEDEVPVWADRVQLSVLVACLLQNSLDAVTDGESIDVEVSNYLDGEGQLARLRITDRGHGLTLLDCEHLFDPFYSGRQAGRGLGFGLSKCWRIATMHGGTIEVESQPDTGTTFVVLLPSASGP